jgi:hypothetical protein
MIPAPASPCVAAGPTPLSSRWASASDPSLVIQPVPETFTSNSQYQLDHSRGVTIPTVEIAT